MRYEADPTKDTAGFPVLPKADYRLKLGEPKAFSGETKEGAQAGQKNFGVAFVCTVVEGPTDSNGGVSPLEHKGKKVYSRLYYHTQDARNYSKGLVIAAFGYSAKEEDQFNAALNAVRAENPEAPELDWSFDSDTGEVGHAWKEMANREIVASLSVQKDKNNNDQQKWESIRPVPESAVSE